MVSDSTLPPSSTLFPGSQYNPWTFLQTSKALGGRRGGLAESTASLRSSPSHQPIPVPPLSRGNRSLRRREPPRTCTPGRRSVRRRVLRARDTSPELSSVEETAGESKAGRPSPQHHAPQPARWNENADVDDEEWIDGDVAMEGITDDLLRLESHTDYVGNPEERC